MLKRIVRCCCALLFVSFTATAVAATAVAEEPIVIKVLCYNIHHGEGTDGVVDIQRVADVIIGCEPDVVALQEVDQKVNRSKRTPQVEQLAERTGLTGRFVKQLDYDGGEYGQAILSKFPILSLETYTLPGQPERETRIVGVALLDVAGRQVQFATTHLHHNRADFRLAQAKRLNEILGVHNVPAILAGDLNATPESEPISVFRESWEVVEANRGKPLLSYPAAEPTKQIDYVLVRPRMAWNLRECRVLDEPVVSDHRPVLFVWELR